jgi:hypothetical protein
MQLKEQFGFSDEQFQAMMDRVALAKAKKQPFRAAIHETYVRALFQLAVEMAVEKRAKREARALAKG